MRSILVLSALVAAAAALNGLGPKLGVMNKQYDLKPRENGHINKPHVRIALESEMKRKENRAGN